SSNRGPRSRPRAAAAWWPTRSSGSRDRFPRGGAKVWSCPRPKARTAPASDLCVSSGPRPSPSLHVLRLLAELVDGGFEREARARELYVGGFRAQRVGFAVEFLRQKIELAANRIARFQQCARFVHMRPQPVQFLAHVGAGGQQRHLLCQAVFGKRTGRQQ